MRTLLRTAQSHAKRLISSTPTSTWFVDPEPLPTRQPREPARVPPPPPNLPQPVKDLHAVLSQSPHLEPSTLVVRDSLDISPGPLLPLSRPKGRRRRGGTYFGEGLPGASSGIWSWIVLAQVKEGTERRGAIESVVRAIRKTLLSMDPPLPLPPNSKRKMQDGWAMIDAGDFAVHILSRASWEKYFSERRGWGW